MDDRDEQSNRSIDKYGLSPARLLLVRCWLELDGERRLVFRGHIHDPAIDDPNDRLLGSFDTFATFRALLINILEPRATVPIV